MLDPKHDGKMAKWRKDNSAERKRLQRERDAREGIREVTVRVPAERVEDIRRMAARLMQDWFAG